MMGCPPRSWFVKWISGSDSVRLTDGSDDDTLWIWMEASDTGM
jgi:hypothetical protein